MLTDGEREKELYVFGQWCNTQQWAGNTAKAWLARAAIAKAREAELLGRIAELEKDAARVNALEDWASSGVVTIGFEIDGGVFLDLAVMGNPEVSYREKDDVRTAIDIALANQPAAAGEEKT